MSSGINGAKLAAVPYHGKGGVLCATGCVPVPAGADAGFSGDVIRNAIHDVIQMYNDRDIILGVYSISTVRTDRSSLRSCIMHRNPMETR